MRYNSDMQKLSIIIPIFNSEKTIQRCLDSVIVQTYSNYEVILVDDGSTDASSEICQKYQKNYHQITYYNIGHHGVSYCRNYGIDKSSGEYIAFVDSDDYIEPMIYENMIMNIISHQSTLSLCGYYTEKGNSSTSNIGKCPTSMTSSETLSSIFTDEAISGFVWNKLYTKELIGNHRFRENISICEDLLFNIELLTSTEAKVSHIDMALYHYILSDESATNTKSYLRNNEFIYKPAFDAIKKLVDNQLWNSCNKKYSDIMQYTMYCLLTSNNLDQAQIKQLKRLMKAESKGTYSNPLFTTRQKLHYRILATCPILYAKVWLLPRL